MGRRRPRRKPPCAVPMASGLQGSLREVHESAAAANKGSGDIGISCRLATEAHRCLGDAVSKLTRKRRLQADALDKMRTADGQFAYPLMFVNRKSLDFIGGADADRTRDLLN